VRNDDRCAVGDVGSVDRHVDGNAAIRDGKPPAAEVVPMPASVYVPFQ
jgi:hypothetical protein